MFLRECVISPCQADQRGYLNDCSGQWNVLLITDHNYDIKGNSDAESLIVGSGDNLAVGRKDTAWNLDARGDAYVSVYTYGRPYRTLNSSLQDRERFRC